MNILLVIAVAIVLLGLGIAGLALNILVKKDGKFPNTHVSGNSFLKSQGICCSQTQDRLARQSAYEKIDYENLMFVPNTKAGK